MEEIEASEPPVLTPVWLVVVLLLFFPPAAWYFMWKEKRYHTWFPLVLVLYGSLTLLISSLYVFVVIPNIMQLYKEVFTELPPSTYSGVILGYTGIGIGIAQALFGIYSWRKVKTSGEMSKTILIITLAILIFNFTSASLTQAFFVRSTLIPIYNLTSEISSIPKFSDQDSKPTIPSEFDDSWVSYKNERFGYEINYPADWKVSPISYAGDLPGGEENPFDQDQAVLIYPEKVTRLVGLTSQLPDNSVYIEVVAIPAEYTFQDWWNDHKEIFEYSFEIADTKTVVKGDQFPTEKIQFDEFNGQNVLVRQTFLLWKDNHLYTIYLKSSKGIEKHQYLKQIADSARLTPNETLLKWNRFTHRSGFSMELPNIATTIEEKTGVIRVVSAMRGELTRCGCGLWLTVEILENPQQLPIPEWWQEKYEQLDEHSQTHAGKEVTPVTIGSYQAYKKVGFGGDSSRVTYFISSGDKIYSIFYSNYPSVNHPENSWQVKVYERILQSFRAPE